MCHHNDANLWDHIGQPALEVGPIHYNDSPDVQNNQTQCVSTFPFIIPGRAAWSGANCGVLA